MTTQPELSLDVVRYLRERDKVVQLVLAGRYGTPEYLAASAALAELWDALDDDEQDHVYAEVLRLAELTGEARKLTPADEPKGESDTTP